MSKTFSLVSLQTNTGICDAGLMSGIPEVEDVQDSRLYKELVEDCGYSSYIEATVKSYCYGEGESQEATAEDLERIKSHPEFLDSKEVTCIKTNNFALLHPDQGRQLNM